MSTVRKSKNFVILNRNCEKKKSYSCQILSHNCEEAKSQDCETLSLNCDLTMKPFLIFHVADLGFHILCTVMRSRSSG